jgi:hypothetical protein
MVHFGTYVVLSVALRLLVLAFWNIEAVDNFTDCYDCVTIVAHS